MLWGILAVMTVAAAGFVLAPLLRQSKGVLPRADYDLEIYRDQLAEIERDAARGVLSGDEAESARTEIGRRALAVSSASTVSAGPDGAAEKTATSRSRPLFWLGVPGAVIPALAVALYLTIGDPFVPDIPPRVAAPEQNRTFLKLIENLKRRMEKNPSDPRGWALLGRSYMRMNRFAQAADAYGKAVALKPEDADFRSRHGEALTYAGKGIVALAAKRAFEDALKIEAGEPRARYYLALADLQEGRRHEALKKWRALEAESPPGAEWLPILRQRIVELAKALGVKIGPPKTAQPRRGPTQEQMQAARNMSPEARAAMIRSMVAGLANRLKKNPDDFDGWARLGQSYRTLDDHEKARDAFAKAVALRPKSVPVLTAYADTLASASAKTGKPPKELPAVLDRLLALDPGNAVGLYLKGAAARVAGENGQARHYWSRLLARIKPGTAQYEGLKKRIDDLDKPAKAGDGEGKKREGAQ